MRQTVTESEKGRHKALKRVVLVGICLAFGQVCVAAPGFIKKWSQSFQISGGDERATDVAVGKTSGNVYVVGDVIDSLGQTFLWINKYDATGNSLWRVLQKGPRIQAGKIALSTSEDVYVMGTRYVDSNSGRGFFIQRYDSFGRFVSSTTVSYDQYDEDLGDVRVDDMGNVYVASPVRHRFSAVTSKYDSNYRPIWSASWSSPQPWYALASAMVLDNAGNVYSAGARGMYTEGVIRKYGNAGIVLWESITSDSQECGGSLIKTVWNFSDAVLGANSVYVVGTRKPITTNSDVVVKKYSSTGVELWEQSYDLPDTSCGQTWNNEEGHAVTVDSRGDVYVAGSVTRSDLGEGINWLMLKYHSDGYFLGKAEYTSLGNNSDSASSIAVDSVNAIYVVGHETVDGQGTNALIGKYVWGDTEATASVGFTISPDIDRLSGTVEISAVPSSGAEIVRVEFRVDGALLGASAVSPFSFKWDTRGVPNGVHTVRVSAHDAAGNVAEKSIGVSVNNTDTVSSGTDAVEPPTTLTVIYECEAKPEECPQKTAWNDVSSVSINETSGGGQNISTEETVTSPINEGTTGLGATDAASTTIFSTDESEPSSSVVGDEETLWQQIVFPPAVQKISVKAGDSWTQLDWQPSVYGEPIEYFIYRSIREEGDFVLVGKTTQTYFRDNTAKNFTIYYYCVAPAKAGMEGTKSEKIVARPRLRPPSDLTATPVSETAVRLDWAISPSGTVLRYAVYRGIQEIDFSTPVAVLSHPNRSFLVSGLRPGVTYLFAVRAADMDGEEENGAIVSATTKDFLDAPPCYSAMVKSPHNGRRVNGERVTVVAELLCSEGPAVRQVRFEFKPVNGSDWLLIPAANENHPNPDFKAPYFVHWNVGSLPEGEYRIRAVAKDEEGKEDPAAGFITIQVDHANPELTERTEATGSHVMTENVSSHKSNVVKTGLETGLAEVNIPAGSLFDPETRLFMRVNPPDVPAPPEDTAGVGMTLDISLENGQEVFTNGIDLVLPYADEDADGREDSSGRPVDTLSLYRYDDRAGKWERNSSSLDADQKNIKANTKYAALYAVFIASATQKAPPADPSFRWGEVYSFPNPAAAGRNPTIHAEVGVADRVDIRIYDLAGELVHDIEIRGTPLVVDDGQGPQYAYEYEWDASEAASGVYLCAVLAHKNGEQSLNKIAKLAVLK